MEPRLTFSVCRASGIGWICVKSGGAPGPADGQACACCAFLAFASCTAGCGDCAVTAWNQTVSCCLESPKRHLQLGNEYEELVVVCLVMVESEKSESANDVASSGSQLLSLPALKSPL